MRARWISKSMAGLKKPVHEQRGNDGARDKDEAEFLVLVHVAVPVGCSQIAEMGTLSAFAVGATGSRAGL